MIRAIVIGASFGGMDATRTILSNLPAGFTVPVIVVLHIGNNSIDTYMSLLNNQSHYRVKEAADKEKIKPGTVYFAPPNYHLLVEDNYTFSLSTDKKVNYSRPSIDVLFETAAWAYKQKLLGVLLTGSNNDGAAGMKTINDYGGTTIVQNPETSYASTMPQSAIDIFRPGFVVDLENIALKIASVCEPKSKSC